MKKIIVSFILLMAAIFLSQIECLRAQNVLTAPPTTATNTITPTVDIVPLTIDNGSASYTSDLQDWKKNGVTTARMDYLGNLTLGAPSSTNCSIIFNNLVNSNSTTLEGSAPAGNVTYEMCDIGQSGNIGISDANTVQTMYLDHYVDMTKPIGTSFTIFTVPINRTFVCTEVVVVTTGINGYISNGSFNVGTTPIGNELLAGFAPTITSQTFKCTYLSGSSLPVVTAGNNVYCSIASSANATTFNVAVCVRGFFYQ